MELNFQIEALKSQIENIKLQLDNIEMQNKSLMMSNPIGEQLINISIQMFNIGIQSFNAGKNVYKNNDTEKFYVRIKKISEQIKTIIADNENEQKQELLKQQFLLQEQNNINNINNIQISNQIILKNIIFQNTTIGVTTNINAPINLTMEELFKRYVNMVYGITKKKISYFYDSNKIPRDDKRKIQEVFGPIESPIIITIESGFMPQ